MKNFNAVELKHKENQFGTCWQFELENIENYAYWNGGFSKEECETIIEIGSSIQMQAGKIFAEGGTTSNIRKCFTSWLYPGSETEWLYRRATDMVQRLNADYFKFDLTGFIEGFQFTKYEAPDGKYGKHVDIGKDCYIRKLSFVLQLSDPKDYEGGELVIHTEDTPIVMKKEQGYLTVFPSYTLHEVTPVTKGTRYSLVGWITGPKFR